MQIDSLVLVAEIAATDHADQEARALRRLSVVTIPQTKGGSLRLSLLQLIGCLHLPSPLATLRRKSK